VARYFHRKMIEKAVGRCKAALFRALGCQKAIYQINRYSGDNRQKPHPGPRPKRNHWHAILAWPSDSEKWPWRPSPFHSEGTPKLDLNSDHHLWPNAADHACAAEATTTMCTGNPPHNKSHCAFTDQTFQKHVVCGARPRQKAGPVSRPTATKSKTQR